MRFLIDTNVLISSEPTRDADVEATTKEALALARAASGTHHLLVHPSVSDEIDHDRDPERRRLRQLVKDRYEPLEHPPGIQPGLVAVLGNAPAGSHDWYDHLLLAALYGNAVHGLVTQDGGIHTKARQLGISDRVYYLADALAAFAALVRQPPEFLPSVEVVPLHALDLAWPFFDSLRDDYPGFDTWYRKRAADGRTAFVVFDRDRACAGLCAIKADDDEVGLGGRVTKITTFKVAGQYKGNRYGELLLKAMFREVHRNGDDAVWVTVLPNHPDLIDLLESFGFTDAGPHGGGQPGERRYIKRLRPPPGAPDLDPLAHHITYGPPAIKSKADQTFIIPIQPGYHESLFPDAPNTQMGLLETKPHGNALRKAYLSHAQVRSAGPGATLLFYRSEDMHAVTTVGVLEDQIVSQDPGEILAFVGTRTVYSTDDVIALAAKNPVLAFLFRQDRFLESPITIDELRGAHAVSGAPQSISHIRSEAHAWITHRIGE